MSRRVAAIVAQPQAWWQGGGCFPNPMLTMSSHAVAFLEGVIKDLTDAKLPRSEQPLLFLRMHVARYLLVLGQTKECKAAIEEGKKSLDSMGDVSVDMPCDIFGWQTIISQVNGPAHAQWMREHGHGQNPHRSFTEASIFSGLSQSQLHSLSLLMGVST